MGGALGATAVVVLVLFPFALLAAVWGLEALERWVITPTEHAAEVARLLSSEDPDTIERQVADLFEEAADQPGRRIRTSVAFRRLIQHARRSG